MKGATLALVAIFVALVFAPALDNGLVDYDDRKTLVEPESRYGGFDLENLRWMFTTFHMGHYQPLAWLSFALDHSLTGLEPRGFHRTNLVFHVANSLLVALLAFELLRRGVRSEGGTLRLWFASVAAALFFGVHPLRVESVAWATERRDVLSLFFLLLAVLSWLRRLEGGRRPWTWYGISLGACLLSLLSKAWAITLPAVLLLLDAWPLRRFGKLGPRSLLLEKVPFVLLAIPFVALAGAAQRSAGAAWSLEDHPPLARAVQATYGACFYLSKSVWPSDLGPIYPLERNLDPARARYFIPLLLAVAASAVLALPRVRRSVPGLSVAWFTYFVLLSPVLGFFQAGPQIAADRYTYLASIPWAVLLGWMFHRLAQRYALSLSISVLVLLGVLGRAAQRQCLVWHDDETLWRRGVAVAPESSFAQYNLAKALLEAGRNEESLPYFESALRLRPDDPKILQDAGAAYGRLGRYAEARAKWLRILERDPDHADALFSLALAAQSQGKREEAIRLYERLLERHPGYAPARARLEQLR